ncbi:Isoquinoline 1-oxidoreductase subunit [Stigmatella sp. ncwal1]|uniref:Isoquinoline 1-oxidoreductase subunit n=1 Tax=Stigmatella ashevillensis TaxID=2995309 RepID=A0ABT5DIU8_9BACT|nr:Isoquinoline 1-oxidoreductase subunit [Stigmatella ashevillena]MDC0713494.1 Isoquinoline 1-oxidoreductase subunit [Stigmatella ashevillena]
MVRWTSHDLFTAPLRTAVLVLLAAGCGRRSPDAGPRPPEALPPVAPGELRAPEVFGVIPDKEERSRALFLEASRVLLHPRCANCHPAGDTPLQGTQGQVHEPPVTRGPEDRGVVGMQCTGCHQDRNLEFSRVPGAPNWHVAPKSMAWVGKTPRAVCEQLKDKSRNGGKSLADIVEHNKHDELVAWGWHPGSGREPAPGSQERFGAIIEAWVNTGAECPSEEAKP